VFLAYLFSKKKTCCEKKKAGAEAFKTNTRPATGWAQGATGPPGKTPFVKRSDSQSKKRRGRANDETPMVFSKKVSVLIPGGGGGNLWGPGLGMQTQRAAHCNPTKNRGLVGGETLWWKKQGGHSYLCFKREALLTHQRV